MKIVKTLSKKVGEIKYWKHIITSIPEKIIKESGLFGKKLKAKAEKGKIIIGKK